MHIKPNSGKFGYIEIGNSTFGACTQLLEFYFKEFSIMTKPTNQDLTAWDKHHYWHGFTQMAEYEPFIIESAKGAVLTDIHGQDFIDGVSSLWCNVHGHRHPKINAAIKSQVDKIAHCTSLGASNSTVVELAHSIANLLPDGLEHVFFSSDGSSSVEVALKLAYQCWQQREGETTNRTKYIALDNAYHGDTLGSVSVGGMPLFHAKFSSLLFDVVRAPSPNARVLPEGVTPENATKYYLGLVQEIMEEHSGEIAALIMEPLFQGAAGMIFHSSGFLRGVRELCTAHGILMIVDEVASGFGRTGTMFAFEQEEIVPDIICMGKGLTGGYMPLAATVASTDVWNAFLGEYKELKTFFHGHTYSGNPLAAAAALASIQIFEEENVLENLKPKIASLGEQLCKIAERPHVLDARQIGFIAAIELAKDPKNGVPYDWQDRIGARVCKEALKHGVWVRPLSDVLIVMPPYCIEEEQLTHLMDAVCKSIESVTEKDL